MKNRILENTHDLLVIDDGTESGHWVKFMRDGRKIEIDRGGCLSISEDSQRAIASWILRREA